MRKVGASTSQSYGSEEEKTQNNFLVCIRMKQIIFLYNEVN